MQAVFIVLLKILDLYQLIIIVTAIMSWLIAFNVINVYNNVVRAIWNGLNALTEPLLRPIRQVLPPMGGLDISPLVLYFAIMLIEYIIQLYILPNVP